jgi:hypothetical protein
MAKGQKRSNKEIRKPKTAPPKTKGAAAARDFMAPPAKKK